MSRLNHPSVLLLARAVALFVACLALVKIPQYILRNPFSVKKMTLESPTDTVIYRSKLNPKINRNFEVFTPPEFLAAITQHIPDKGV